MRPANIDGLTAMERHACELRSGGITQIEAYLISHKRKRGEGRGAESAAYKLFSKTVCRTYLDKLWAEKPLEAIFSPQRWLGGTLDLRAMAIEAKAWAPAASLNRQAGQAVTALRDSMEIVTDGAARDRELIDLVAGEDKGKRKALALLMGSHDVFGPHLVADNTGASGNKREGPEGKGQ